jgi:valyl-tRNA synthetase
MMMMGLNFMDEVPFKDVYIHAIVRDEKGAKMSKSKGNVIDPLTIVDQYGADALRFTLAAMAAQGRDIKLSTARVEGYRNFATKIWNAARFAELNGCARVEGFDPGERQATAQPLDPQRGARAADEIAAGIRASNSTRRRARPIASSGTSSATGISNSPSRCCRARASMPPRRPRRRRPSRMSST